VSIRRSEALHDMMGRRGSNQRTKNQVVKRDGVVEKKESESDSDEAARADGGRDRDPAAEERPREL
jgi:hypothetical protein